MGRSGTYCNWRVIIYPESLKNDWKTILQNTLIQFAVSPLHEYDYWTEDDPHFDSEKYSAGELKKPHYHLVVHYGGSKTFNAVRRELSVINQDNKEPNVIPVYGDVGSSVRYLSHFDEDPYKKHIYDSSKIESYNGFDVNRYFKLTKEQEADLTNQIRRFIKGNKIFEYSDLLDVLGDVAESDVRYSDFREMYLYCIKHTIFITAYVRSHKFRNRPKDVCDQTGAPVPLQKMDRVDPEFDEIQAFNV